MKLDPGRCVTTKASKKASFYIAQYPVLRTIQRALHFISLTDLFTQTPSQLLWEASSHMLQLMREVCSSTYPPLSIIGYSFIQLSELEQCSLPKVLTPQHRMRTRVLVVESPKLYLLYYCVLINAIPSLLQPRISFDLVSWRATLQ